MSKTRTARAGRNTRRANTVRTAPKRFGIISMLWDLLDTANGEVTSKHLPAIAEKTGLNMTTVRIQFYNWRAHRAVSQ